MHHGSPREGVCMKRIYHMSIDPSVRSIATENQLKGLFFESLCLGATADGSAVTDLKRKPNGEKTIAQERLEAQHSVFELGCVKHFITVAKKINTQVKVFKRFNDYAIIQATTDLFPTQMLYEKTILPVVAIDIKVTGDLDNDFGEFGWGNVDNMDHTQMILTNYILRDIDMDLNAKMDSNLAKHGLIRHEYLDHLQNVPVFYWVFEHGKKMRNRIFKVNVDSARIRELEEVLRKVIIIIEDEFVNNGWQANPSYKECEHCPLNYLNGGTCNEAQIIKEV